MKPNKVKKTPLLLRPAFVLCVVVLAVSGSVLYLGNSIPELTPSLIFLIITLTVFAAAMAYEVISRRQWEYRLSAHLYRLEKELGFLEIQNQELEEENTRLSVVMEGLVGQWQNKAEREAAWSQEMKILQAEQNIHDVVEKTTTERIVRQNLNASKKPTQDYDLPSFDEESVESPSTDDQTTEILTQETVENNGHIAEVQNADAVDQLSDAVVSELISTAVREDRVDIFLQPIVRLPQRKISFYEVYARPRAKKGLYLPASRYLPLAQGDLLPAIDNMLFMRSIQLLRSRRTNNQSVAYFLNVNASTLKNSTFMADLVDFLGDNRHLAGRLIFEFSQKDFKELGGSVFPVLKGLAELGCRFSMDQVTDLSLDVMQLLSYNLRFIKIDAAMILEATSNNIGNRAFLNLKKELDDYGIDLIVQKVEKESDLLELLDTDIDFGQGYLFGEPEHSQKIAA